MAYNKLPLLDRLLRNAIRVGDCLIWQGAKYRNGYGMVRVNGKWMRTNRASFIAHHGPIPDGMLVMHSCDTPLCIEPNHLSAGTQLDNMQDMHAKGRAKPARGERSGVTKLTQAKVDEIRRRYRPRSYGHGMHSLAKEFGVSKPAIRAILRRESWA